MLRRKVQSVLARYGLGEDYRAIDIIILIIVGLILVCRRRLEHLGYISEEPPVKRFYDLMRLRQDRSADSTGTDHKYGCVLQVLLSIC